jgi:hypothetical protein
MILHPIGTGCSATQRYHAYLWEQSESGSRTLHVRLWHGLHNQENADLGFDGCAEPPFVMRFSAKPTYSTAAHDAARRNPRGSGLPTMSYREYKLAQTPDCRSQSFWMAHSPFCPASFTLERRRIPLPQDLLLCTIPRLGRALLTCRPGGK